MPIFCLTSSIVSATFVEVSTNSLVNGSLGFAKISRVGHAYMILPACITAHLLHRSFTTSI